MGIGFVLLIWAVAGTILAGIGTLLFGGLTSLLTRKVTRGRRRVIIAAGLLPFACLIWAGALFVFQALVNEGVLHRDPGLGDTWHCPLPNGYALMMIDVTDQGWVYNPKTQPGDGVGEQDDAVAGVRIVQIAGRYIAGGSDTRSFQHLGQNSSEVDSYFLLDTQTGKQTKFKSYGELLQAASQLPIQLDLKPIDHVYSQYRFTKFDVFVGLLLAIPPLLAVGLLVWWIVRLRRIDETLPQPV
jgi:hypothetical protein